MKRIDLKYDILIPVVVIFAGGMSIYEIWWGTYMRAFGWMGVNLIVIAYMKWENKKMTQQIVELRKEYEMVKEDFIKWADTLPPEEKKKVMDKFNNVIKKNDQRTKKISKS